MRNPLYQAVVARRGAAFVHSFPRLLRSLASQAPFVHIAAAPANAAPLMSLVVFLEDQTGTCIFIIDCL